MKAIRSNRNISPHGGAVPILTKIKEFGIPQIITSCLGKRKEQSMFGYDDVFIAWILTALCGGTRLDHVSKLKNKLSIIPGLKLPSHDTIGRVMKSLATETQTKRGTKKGANKVSYTKVNENIALNRMLIMATKRMGLLREGYLHTLDIDATFVPSKCYDAIISKKNKKHGYCPMVCLIGNLPVFVSMRSGNAAASFELAKCLEQCLALLEENNIKVGRVISDGAGQNKALMELLDKKGIKYVVRMPLKKNNGGLVRGLRNSEWKQTEIETANYFWQCEVVDFPYKMKYSKMNCRVIALRVPDKETRKKIEDEEENERREFIETKMSVLEKKDLLKKQNRHAPSDVWVNFEGYDYKVIITNDHVRTSEALIREYNKRGGAERNFDFMKNDFAWRLPPFMNMNENTVFLIAAALANNIFRGVVKLFRKLAPEIKLQLTTRLRDFQYIFVDVACELVNKVYVFYNTDIAYEKLME